MSNFGFRIEEAEVAPGTLGLLYDETPQLTTAHIRPFIWAILLYRGAVKSHEIVGAVTPICGHSELYAGWSDDLDLTDNRTRFGVACGRGSGRHDRVWPASLQHGSRPVGFEQQ